MYDLTAALIAAAAIVAGAWLSQPGRRALGIHRYLNVYNDLPQRSKERANLAREIDEMVASELANRKMNEVLRFIWIILAYGSVTWVVWLVALSAGGTWWVPVVTISGVFVLLLIAGGFRAVRAIGVWQANRRGD